jgi:hypothetical protein
MIYLTHRLMEAALNDGGQGGAPAPTPAPTPAEWLKPFGEHAKAFESFKDPADLAKAWTDTQAKVKDLEGKADWRKVIGGDDAEAQKALQRFTDPKAFYKSYSEAQAKIRSGELAKPLAKEATAEQIAEWRKANGVPEKVEEYFAKLPNGRVLGKEDQPLFNEVAERLHKQNVPTAVMHDLVDWYYSSQESQAAAERQLDDADRQKAITALRNEWGPDYKANMNILDSWLDGLGPDLKKSFQNAILGDGSRLMNNVGAVKWLVDLARNMNPTAGLIPGGDGGMKSVESEIARIENVMRTNRSAYNKDAGMQEQLRKLYEAREKLQAQK